MGIFDKLFNLNVKSDVEENVADNITPTIPSGDYDFMMPVDDVFSITGRGIVVTGRIAEGEIHVGDTVSINGGTTVVVSGIEQFRSKKEFATAGENVGLLLGNISRDSIQKGDTLTK